jgi:hypothetical protein
MQFLYATTVSRSKPGRPETVPSRPISERLPVMTDLHVTGPLPYLPDIREGDGPPEPPMCIQPPNIVTL